jgi:glycosyltransferase involved in cell wall biosynthesis
VHETKTTTLSLADVSTRTDTCAGSRIRMLCVSRIDPRKGLRLLPEVVRRLVSAGHDVTLDVVGPTIGLIGESERDAILDEARQHGVADRVHLRGPVALDQLMPLYRDFDLFVLPTRPGEGIPRVLMEAMAAGLPVVTTDVSGIASLITSGENGLLVPEGSTPALVEALDRLIGDAALRQRLIEHGYATARAHTLEQQAASLIAIVARECGLPIRHSDAA